MGVRKIGLPDDIPDGYVTFSHIRMAVGKSPKQLKRWIEHGVLKPKPNLYLTSKKRHVRLFSIDQFERLLLYYPLFKKRWITVKGLKALVQQEWQAAEFLHLQPKGSDHATQHNEIRRPE